jgi:uncharacterized protein YecE (DUF72 family)
MPDGKRGRAGAGRGSKQAPAGGINIFAGTSGWNYRHWKGPFYPEDIKDREMLEFYGRSFSTVELNNSFYHLPTEKSVLNWRDSTPDNFIFAVKASRFITHIKRLKDCEEPVKTLLDRMGSLDKKLGPILFQTPPGLKFDPGKLKEFISVLPKKFRYVFEFRNTGWVNDETYKILADNGLTFCVYDFNGYFTPREITSDLVYFRLHGPAGKYAGSYPDSFLSELTAAFRKYAREGRAVFCYFDNDYEGYAALNALTLKGLIEKAGVRAA